MRALTPLHRVLAVGLGLAVTTLGTTAGVASTSTAHDGAPRVEAQQRPGTLTSSPAAYTAGQAISFSGNLGARGVRPISLQLHMGRPGDQWFGVRGFRAKTRANGSFDFTYPAPSMRNIRYRVVSTKGRVTTPVNFLASEQEIDVQLTESATRTKYDVPFATAGQPFTMGVQTSPILPVLSGRPVALEMRTAPGDWQRVASTRLADDGTAAFPGLVAPAAGTVVYRAVQADVTGDGNKIGWTQSFPRYVSVYEPGTEPSRDDYRRPAPVRRTVVPTTRSGEAAGPVASSRFNWWPALYDYTWEAGQSLNSPPELGNLKKGYWEDWADGTGRVARWNGGLNLDSGPGSEDIGTTRATLRGAGRAYGRWEARLRFIETGDFAVRVELVPADAADYACGRRNVLLAEVSGASSRMTFGVNAQTTQWRGTHAYGALTSAPALAVEVAKDHITWFLDSKPIGTVKKAAAVSGVPMTLRFSVIGDQTPGRASTNVNSDWQRAFSIKPGKQVKGGKALKSSPLTTCE